MRTLGLALSLISLPACLANIDDNSLEAQELSGLDGGEEASGALAVTAEAEEGDWSLALGDRAIAYHSPSRADLSLLDGLDLRAEVLDSFYGSPGLSLWEGEELVFHVSNYSDGADLFGEARWEFGEELGQGEVVNDYDEATPVIFRQVVVHGDEGDQIVEPGEPVRVALDGVDYRLTVIAAYEIDIHYGPFEPQPGCGPSDMLTVELIRSPEDPGQRITRPPEARAAMASCG